MCNATVAIIEAGDFYELSNGNWSQLPYWHKQWRGGEDYDWQSLIVWGLMTEPQLSGKRLHYAQGRGFGGSSGRNQMLYHRATKGFPRAWADRVGNQAYTWDNMLKYMQRSVKHQVNEHRPQSATPTPSDKAYSPDGGPLSVTYPATVDPFSVHAPAAFGNIGLKMQNDFNGGEMSGYGYWTYTINAETGLRSSAENSFLAEAMGRPTLTTYINADVRNILFDGECKATGINVTTFGKQPFTVTARKEVIVSAGAFHSLQLLMVSGIGPKETLQKYDIPVVKDPPGVGQNMWDTANIGGPRYQISVAGPLSDPGNTIGAWDIFPDTVWSKLSPSAQAALAKFPSDWPEVEYAFTSSGKLFVGPNPTDRYGIIGCQLVKTVSRGNMTIQSASNDVPLVINPNWLRDPIEQEVAVQAHRRARQAWEGVPEGIKIGDEVWPGKNVTTNEELLHLIRENIKVKHHGAASCAMGKDDDPDAVVDSKGRVFGVQGLRVIDSSSLPFAPPGHTQGITYAHAEKLVDDMLGDWDTAILSLDTEIRENITLGVDYWSFSGESEQ
ncbi:oxidoreductase GMC like protein [Zymoseptoria brevis]|uniref:Oxidoreductase GMC like protein n=1 Tax=Zymoseptoria brevis TaxID=1047168 RepID=A0A0F4GEQ9_9PEZI|nr:oxidoreductase GMC like protein [Zymoseptoria brevis]